MNIAIFGGSFDPPHFGHDLIVKTALKSLNIDKLIIVPAFLNPFKTHSKATPGVRLAWCERLWGGLEGVEVSNYEIAQNRAVASIESVLHFKNLYNPKKIFLIIGADQIATLNRWRDYEILASLVEFVVATRDNIKIPPNLKKLSINAKISSSKIRSECDFSEISRKILGEVSQIYKGQ